MATMTKYQCHFQKFPIDDKGDNGSGGVAASCHPTLSWHR